MSRRLVLDDVTALELPSAPAVSPDGGRVAYVVRSADVEEDGDRTRIWLADLGTEDPSPRRLTAGPHDGTPRWSPDGARLAFVRHTDDGSQVHVLDVASGDVRQVTSATGGADDPRWSPDGERLAFCASGEHPDGVDTSGPVPVVVTRLDHKWDGAGLLPPGRRQVHVVDVASGEARQVTSGPGAGEPRWSPDGRWLSVVGPTGPRSDVTMETGVLVLEADAQKPVATDEQLPLWPAHGLAETAEWLPEGDALLVVGRDDVAASHVGLVHVPLDGGRYRDLVASLDRNVRPGVGGWWGAPPRVLADGQHVVFSITDRGCTHVYSVGLPDTDAEGQGPRPLVTGAATNVAAFDVGPGDRVVAILGAASTYDRLVELDLRADDPVVATVADPAAASLPEVEVLASVERWFTVSDGTRVQGWVLRDPSTQGPSPLLVDVHGGPHLAWSGCAEPVNPYHQLLAARGWTVLMLNPRGSDGYGEAFYTACLGRWGVGDAADVLEPVDQLVADGTADAERLAVYGYSYGSFLTAYLTSHTDRFAAAGAGGLLVEPYLQGLACDFGAAQAALENGPSDDRSALEAQSPLARVGDVRTPTLLLQGTEDERTPRSQADAWFSALRVRDVPVELVLYPGGSHGFPFAGRPSWRRDYTRRIVDWFTTRV